MDITVSDEGIHQIFHFSGEIAFEDTPRIEDFVYQNLSTGFNDIVLDLKSVPYLNSSALGAFVRIQETLRARNIPVVLLHPNNAIMNLLNLTGIRNHFIIADTLQDIK